MNQKKVLLGTIVSVKGLKGEVKVKSYTLNPLSLLDYNITDENGNVILITSVYLHKNILIAKIRGIDTKEQADTIIGLNLFTFRNDLLPLEDEESFYYVDLIGLLVKNESNNIVGKVKNVSNYGAHDIIEILLDNNETFMVPFLKNFVPEINIKEGYLVISDTSSTI